MTEPNIKENKENEKSGREPDVLKEPAVKVKKRRRWPLFVIPILILGIFFFLFPSQNKIEGEAELKASEYVEIQGVEEGRLVTIHHKRGEWVKKGDLLAALQNEEITQEITETLKKMDVFKETKEFLNKKYRFLKKEKGRKKLLFENGLIGQSSLDLSQVELLELKELISQKTKEGEILKEKVGFLREKEKALKIYAPFSALILSDSQGIAGGFVKKGDAIFELVNPSSFYLEFLILEKDVKKVSLGDSAKIKFYSSADQSFSGEITKIGFMTTKEVEKVFKVKYVIPCEISLKSLPAEMRIGSKAWVSIFPEMKKSRVLQNIKEVK